MADEATKLGGGQERFCRCDPVVSIKWTFKVRYLGP